MLARVGGYITVVPDEGSSTVTALDGTDASFAPISVIRVDSAIESSNVVTPLIDGDVGVTLIGDRPPSGELVLLFSEDVSMLAARQILARPTTFYLDVPTRPVLSMRFARQGKLTPGMHDDVRQVWEFRVEYQEVTL